MGTPFFRAYELSDERLRKQSAETERKQRMLRLHREGLSLTDMACRLGISRTTVKKWVRELGLLGLPAQRDPSVE